MTASVWSEIVPTPRVVLARSGVWRLPESRPCRMVSHTAVAEPVVRWLQSFLAARGVGSFRAAAPTAGGDLHVGLVGDLVAAGLAAPSTAAACFRAPWGEEQGYWLEVGEGGVRLAAQGLPGLRHGAATLVQALTLTARGQGLPAVRLEDWPAARFRVADWLLNAEINRWGLERGDGLEGLWPRLERHLDLAVCLKLNVIWFDGFGWRPDRTPGYAALTRRLAGAARERGLRLAHAGYGGGYGFAYQTHFIYAAPYHGECFQNRSTYPDGPVYDCVGHPRYAASWRYGTCLSNPALAERKLAELVGFVRVCQPGLLYIHDIDTGDYDLAWEGWRRRCPGCRQRWPDDAMVSARGAAGAYAQWYHQVADAVNAVRSEDGSYVAARDCEVVFVGPVYTAAQDTEETWAAEVEYVALVSELMGPCANVEFGLREQVCAQPDGRGRIATLAARLERVGHGHGIFIVAFAGGDNYFSDTPLPAGAALAGRHAGARTLYTKHLGAVVPAAQALVAEYAWNPDAPGALAEPRERAGALELLRCCQAGRVWPAAWAADGGVLGRACRWLYGGEAAAAMARWHALGMVDGLAPVLTGWGAVSREVAALLNPGGRPAAAPERAARWRQRRRVTAAGLDLVRAVTALPASAWACPDDLAWLALRLEIGHGFASALAAAWDWRLQPGEGTARHAEEVLRELAELLRRRVGRDTTDPVGGDVAVWFTMLDRLQNVLAPHGQDTPASGQGGA